MKAFVITLKGIKESEELSKRAFLSAKENGYDVNVFNAVKPKDNPSQIFRQNGIELKGWIKDSNSAALSCWASHFMLWKKSIELNEPFLVLEHDAVVQSEFPPHLIKRVKQIVNLGAPGYIDAVDKPEHIEWIRKGLGRLRSFNKFPGTHGYIVTPKIDEIIGYMEREGIEDAIDYFLTVNKFSKLQEYMPWCVSAESDFTTIQTEAPRHFDGLNFKRLNHIIDPNTGEHYKTTMVDNILYRTPKKLRVINNHNE